VASGESVRHTPVEQRQPLDGGVAERVCSQHALAGGRQLGLVVGVDGE